MASNKGQSSCIAYLWISFLVVGIVPGVVSIVELTSNLSTVQQICPGKTIEFTCTTESSRLLWTSDEYIGVGSQFEFRIIDPIGITDTNAATIANLTDINGGVLTSTLLIVTSRSSTITCINGDDRTAATSLVQIAAVPGAPRNVMAVGSVDDCMIHVTWEPPADTGVSNYTYRVDVPSQNITANTNSSTESILHVPDCADDIPIQVYAVNRFDCMRSAETLLRLQSGSTTTAPSQLGVGAVVGIIIGVTLPTLCFLGCIFVCICYVCVAGNPTKVLLREISMIHQKDFRKNLIDLYTAIKKDSSEDDKLSFVESLSQMMDDQTHTKQYIKEAVKIALKTIKLDRGGDVKKVLIYLKTNVPRVLESFNNKLQDKGTNITMDSLIHAAEKNEHEKVFDELIEIMDNTEPEIVEGLLRTMFEELQIYLQSKVSFINMKWVTNLPSGEISMESPTS